MCGETVPGARSDACAQAKTRAEKRQARGPGRLHTRGHGAGDLGAPRLGVDPKESAPVWSRGTRGDERVPSCSTALLDGSRLPQKGVVMLARNKVSCVHERR